MNTDAFYFHGYTSLYLEGKWVKATPAFISAMHNTDQGGTTSHTLAAMLKTAVAAAFPDLDLEGLDKVGVLDAVFDKAGASAIVALGRTVRHLGWHPVVRAVVAARPPDAIVERWIRVERWGHSRNRTRIIERKHLNNTSTLTLRHVTTDGGKIVVVNDLLIWGVFIGLMEATGIKRIHAVLPSQTSTRPLRLHGPSPMPPLAMLPAITLTLVTRGRMATRKTHAGDAAPADDADGCATLVRRQLAKLLRHDLLEDWSVADAARALKLSRRSMQRALREIIPTSIEWDGTENHP